MNLGTFKPYKKEISELYAGLNIELDGYSMIYGGKKLFSFSKEFKKIIDDILSSNYVFEYAIIKNIVIWKDSEENIEYPIILPELHFKNNKENKNNSKDNRFREEINNVLLGISAIYKKYPNFRFSYFSLVDFLQGNESNSINAFKLYDEKEYGIFSEKESYFAKKLISELKKLKILTESKNEKGYNKIELLVENIDDNQALLLEKSLY